MLTFLGAGIRREVQELDARRYRDSGFFGEQILKMSAKIICKH